jgi:hypothetical protein
MRKIALAASIASISFLSACAPASRFEWGNYEMALYAYAKNPAARDTYRQALVTAIEQGRSTDRIAPGLLAELGYLYLEDGDRSQAVRYFEEEMRLFPESAPFLTRVIARVNAGASSAAIVTLKQEAAS